MQRTIRRIAISAMLLLVALATFGSSSVSSNTASVTFTKDVAPIFYKNCAYCHRPGEIAPMSLMTFKDARPWAKSIRERCLTERCLPGTPILNTALSRTIGGSRRKTSPPSSPGLMGARRKAIQKISLVRRNSPKAGRSENPTLC